VPAAPVGKIHIFDSSVGGFRKEKELAVSRVKLFAREVDCLWRMGNPCAPVVNEWQTRLINAPVQRDGYNCGPFALAHIWCAVNGKELVSIRGVPGDHMRLAILCSILQCGKRYEDARLAARGGGGTMHTM